MPWAWRELGSMSSLKDALLKLLEQFHNPELVGSILVIYVIVSPAG